MKKNYEQPDLVITEFSSEGIMTTSSGGRGFGPAITVGSDGNNDYSDIDY